MTVVVVRLIGIHVVVENSEGVFAWSDEDLVRLQKIDVIVAGDGMLRCDYDFV